MPITIDTLAREAGLNTSGAFLYSDGKPMAETYEHTLQMLATLDVLRWHFRDDPRGHLIGNMFVYYLDPLGRQRVAPDIFVVRGVSKKKAAELFRCERGQSAGNGHRIHLQENEKA
jgi:hypothetical protein